LIEEDTVNSYMQTNSFFSSDPAWWSQLLLALAGWIGIVIVLNIPLFAPVRRIILRFWEVLLDHRTIACALCFFLTITLSLVNPAMYPGKSIARIILLQDHSPSQWGSVESIQRGIAGIVMLLTVSLFISLGFAWSRESHRQYPNDIQARGDRQASAAILAMLLINPLLFLSIPYVLIEVLHGVVMVLFS
jgi:hypothetical protein